MPIPTPDQCRENAHRDLSRTEGGNPDWVQARATQAIGWIMLADSQEKREEASNG